MYNLQVGKNIWKMSKSYIKFTFQRMPLPNNLQYKMVRNEIYNLHSRLVQFKDQKKAKNVHNS